MDKIELDFTIDIEVLEYNATASDLNKNNLLINIEEENNKKTIDNNIEINRIIESLSNCKKTYNLFYIDDLNKNKIERGLLLSKIVEWETKLNNIENIRQELIDNLYDKYVYLNQVTKSVKINFSENKFEKIERLKLLVERIENIYTYLGIEFSDNNNNTNVSEIISVKNELELVYKKYLLLSKDGLNFIENMIREMNDLVSKSNNEEYFKNYLTQINQIQNTIYPLVPIVQTIETTITFLKSFKLELDKINSFMLELKN